MSPSPLAGKGEGDYKLVWGTPPDPARGDSPLDSPSASVRRQFVHLAPLLPVASCAQHGSVGRALNTGCSEGPAPLTVSVRHPNLEPNRGRSPRRAPRTVSVRQPYLSRHGGAGGWAPCRGCPPQHPLYSPFLAGRGSGGVPRLYVSGGWSKEAQRSETPIDEANRHRYD